MGNPSFPLYQLLPVLHIPLCPYSDLMAHIQISYYPSTLQVNSQSPEYIQSMKSVLINHKTRKRLRHAQGFSLSTPSRLQTHKDLPLLNPNSSSYRSSMIILSFQTIQSRLKMQAYILSSLHHNIAYDSQNTH